MRHYVEISNQALLQIIMSSVEAFVVVHEGRKRSGIEMHGHFFGNTEKTASTTRHRVELFSADTATIMRSGHCIPDAESRNIKSEIAKCFFEYELLGDIHTHPYLNHEFGKPESGKIDQLKYMREVGNDFSTGDLEGFKSRLISSQSDYLIEGVFALIPRPRQSFEGDQRRDKQIFEFSLGNVKCFLRMQVFSLDANQNLLLEPTIVKCNYLEKFDNISGSLGFGKIVVKEGKQRILEHKPKA